MRVVLYTFADATRVYARGERLSGCKPLDKFKNMCYNHNTKLKQERTKKENGH